MVLQNDAIRVLSCVLPTICSHNVAPQGKWIAFVSTTVETSNPEAELAQGLALLGPIEERFVEVTPIHEPIEGGKK